MGAPRARTQVVVNLSQGLHLRPLEMLVTAAKQFSSTIEIVKQHQRADGKSILAVLGLGAEEGTVLAIEAEGEDASEAVTALAELFANGFREEPGPPAPDAAP